MLSAFVDDASIPRPAERARLGALCAFVAAWSAATTIAWVVGQAWTVSELPGALGGRYAVAGALGTALVAGWWWALGRVRQDHAAVGVAIGALVCAGALGALWRYAPAHPAGTLGFGMALALDTIGVAMASELARATFSASEERRLAWFVTTSAVAAPVITGLAVLLLAPRVAISQLITVEIGLFAVAVAALAALSLTQRGRFAPDRSLAPPEPSLRADLDRVIAGPIPRATAGYGLGVGVALALCDALLGSAQVGRELPQIIRFYAGFVAWGTVIGALVGYAISRSVLERFGVLVGVLVLPVALSGGLIAALLADGAPWAITGARMMPLAFGPGAIVALRLIHLPTAAAFRPRAVLLFRALTVPLATLVAGGIALIVGASGASPAVAALIAALVALAAGTLAWDAWTRAVAGTVTRTPTLPIVDAGARPALAAALAATDPSTVLNALDLVATIDDPRAWSDDLAGLLGNPSPLVRARTLCLLARTPGHRHIEAVRSRISDPEPEVRAAAIGTYFEMAGAAAVPDAKNLLADPHPAVRSALVEGLMSHGGGVGTRIAGEELRKMVNSDEPRLRSAAARVVGTMYDPTVRQMLLGLLGDRSADVRSAALEVAGTTGDAALLPRLVIALQDRKTTAAAARALSRFRDGIERDLGFAIDDERRPVETRAQLARIVGRMGTPRALEALVVRIAVGNDLVRTAVHGAIARITESRGLIVPADLADAQLAEEIRLAEEWTQRWIDVGGTSARGTLLEGALRGRVDGAVERSFLLIRARWPRHARALEKAFADWSAGRVDDGAAADRVLGFLQGDLRERIALVLARSGTPTRTVDDTVTRLLSSVDPWLIVAALEYAGSRGRTALLAEIDEMAGEPQPDLIGEAVAFAASTLRGVPRGDAMISTVEKILVLKAVPLLSAIPAEQLVSVAQIAKPVRFEQGAIVFRKGDQGDSLYLVVHGTAVVSVGDREVARLGPGEVFGEMALLDLEPRSADVSAGTPIVALRISRDEFHDLIDDRPEVLRGIVRVLTQRLRAAVAR